MPAAGSNRTLLSVRLEVFFWSSPDLICSSLGALLAKHPVHTGQIWVQIPAQPLPKNPGISEVVHLQNGANGVSPDVGWEDGLRKPRQGSACRLRHVCAWRQGVWFFFPSILTHLSSCYFLPASLPPPQTCSLLADLARTLLPSSGSKSKILKAQRDPSRLPQLSNAGN